jgi:hypothetical protein
MDINFVIGFWFSVYTNMVDNEEILNSMILEKPSRKQKHQSSQK